MTLMLELPAALEECLKKEAEKRGVKPEEYARTLVEKGLSFGPPDEATLKLLRQWEERDATDDPEEIARRERDLEQFMAAMNQTRQEARARKIYP
jgi:hypothetical protein